MYTGGPHQKENTCRDYGEAPQKNENLRKNSPRDDSTQLERRRFIDKNKK